VPWPITERLHTFLELFGWYVVAAHPGPVPVHDDGEATVAGVWELASRWSPPHARLCLLFFARGERLLAIESAVIAASGTVCRLPGANRLAIGGAVDVETFVANLGRHRSHPGVRTL